MGDSNTRRRFATFTSEATMSKCTRANAFFISYAHLQQQAAGGLYDINSLPEQTPILGFLSSPIEGLALFAPARDPRSDCALPPIIPDLTISTSNNTKIYDVKGRRSRNIRI